MGVRFGVIYHIKSFVEVTARYDAPLTCAAVRTLDSYSFTDRIVVSIHFSLSIRRLTDVDDDDDDDKSPFL